MTSWGVIGRFTPQFPKQATDTRHRVMCCKALASVDERIEVVPSIEIELTDEEPRRGAKFDGSDSHEASRLGRV